MMTWFSVVFTLLSAAPGVTASAPYIDAGDDHTLALFGDGKIKVWGHNRNGQLGQGDDENRGDDADEMGDKLTPVDLGTGRLVTQVAAGSEHSCAVFDNGQMKCWGSNWEGQLGYGDNDPRGDNLDWEGDEMNAGVPREEMGDSLPTVDLGTSRTVKEIALGDSHTCVLLDNSQVKCWGTSWAGQLGNGKRDDIGAGPDEMGDKLAAVDLGAGRLVTHIAAGSSHTCALLDNSQMKCWGLNGDGQLGYGDTNRRGDGAGEMGDKLPTVDLGTSRTVKEIALGQSHTCVLLDNSRVKCWGTSWAGQLGNGKKDDIGAGPDEMGDKLAAVDLGASRLVTHIAAGGWHTCALLDNSQMKCWGRNDNGQLGYGDDNHRGDDTDEMGDVLPAINLGAGASAEQIATGGQHTCAVTDNDDLKCWGDNEEGQLGRGDTSSIGDADDEMGANLKAIYNMPPPTITTTGTTTATANTPDYASIDAAVAGHGGVATLVALGAAAAVALQF